MSFELEVIKGGDFSVEPGVYLGTLVTLIDMGIQSRGTFNGEKLSDAPIIGVEFEVIKEDGSTVKLFKELLKSGHEKSTIYSMALALLGGGTKAEEELGTGFKVDKLLGKSAALTVGKTSGKKPKITAFTALMKGQTVPSPKAELVKYSVDSPDEETLAKLPKFIQSKLGTKLKSEDDESDF